MVTQWSSLLFSSCLSPRLSGTSCSVEATTARACLSSRVSFVLIYCDQKKYGLTSRNAKASYVEGTSTEISGHDSAIERGRVAHHPAKAEQGSGGRGVADS